MGQRPSIKGVLLSKLVPDVQELLERNEAARERLLAPLSAGSVELLEGKVEIGRWYPIEQYAEITDLIWQEEGDGSPAYLQRRGAEAMQRLMDGGLYQQLRYLGREDGGFRTPVTREQVLRDCRLVGSVTGALINFTEQSWDWDPARPDVLLHEIREATDFPDCMRHIHEGVETLLVRLARPDAPAVTSERPTRDHIVFTYDYTGVFERGD